MKVIAVKLNQSLRIQFLYLLLKLWNLTTDKPAVGTKSNINKEKLLEFVREALSHLKSPFIYCSLYLHKDKKVYLCPQEKPRTDIDSSLILGLSVWLKKLKGNQINRTDLIEIFGEVKTKDLVSKQFIENFDKMAEEYNIVPIISNIGDNLRISSSSDNSDEENSTHEIVLDINESLNLMEISKNEQTEPKKPEQILRSSTLSKIIRPLISKFDDKPKNKITEQKTSESLTGFFEKLPELPTEVKTEQEPVSFYDSIQHNNLIGLNNLTVKSDVKNSLPDFSPEFDSAESWAEECLFIFSLLGYKTQDERVMISSMLNKLGKELAAAVQQNLSKLNCQISDLKIKDFVEILANLTKKTEFEMEKHIENLKIDFGSQASYRSTYWRLKNLLSRQLEIDSTTPLNTKNIDKLVAREFKKKLPASVTQNLTFRMSEIEGIGLADLAFNINQLSNLNLNNFKTFSSNRGNFRGRGNFGSRFSTQNNRGNFRPFQPHNRGNFNTNRGSYRGFQHPRGQFNRFQRPQYNSNSTNYRNLKCHFCGHPGHIERMCRKKMAGGGRGQTRNYNY